jgi:hypothetical protein
MTRTERNRCVRWRLGWLPGGKLEPCPRHPTQILMKQHAIKYLDMHSRLQMPETVQGPLLFLPLIGKGVLTSIHFFIDLNQGENDAELDITRSNWSLIFV